MSPRRAEEVTTGEAAEILGVSRSTIVRYVEAGILPARKLPGGHLRIRREDVERLSGEQEPKD
jgi:excisionase family DNA binding protein